MHVRARHLLAIAAAATVWLAACEVPDNANPYAVGPGTDSAGSDALAGDTGPVGPLLTCESCHTSEDLLKAALANQPAPPPKESTADG